MVMTDAQTTQNEHISDFDDYVNISVARGGNRKGCIDAICDRIENTGNRSVAVAIESLM